MNKEKIRNDYREANESKDVEKMRAFFLKYNFFTTNDLAQIINMSGQWLRTKKKKCGFGYEKPRGPIPVNYSNLPRDREIDITNWRTPEWWRAHYPKYGKAALSRALGRNPHRVRYYIRKYCGGMLTYEESMNKNIHPCCNKEWLTKHYCEENLGLAACGKLAGVSPDTIITWLNRLKIQVSYNGINPVLGEKPRV